MTSPLDGKKIVGSGFLKIFIFFDFWPISGLKNAKNRIFSSQNGLKIEKNENFQKSAPIEFFAILRASHSQKTGFLGPKLEEELGKTSLF